MCTGTFLAHFLIWPRVAEDYERVLEETHGDKFQHDLTYRGSLN